MLLCRPIQTRFRYASGLKDLKLATFSNSSDHYAKGTPSAIHLAVHRPPTACRSIISGSISLPSRGSFQLSLTVLVHFRSELVFRLSPWSGQIPARFPVPGSTWDASRMSWNFAYKTLTLFGVFFQTLLLSHFNTTLRSRNPNKQACWFSLFSLRSPLLRESHSVSSPRVT